MSSFPGSAAGGNTISNSGHSKRQRKRFFSSNATWTVPAGVFFATVELAGGGAGASNPGSAAGGNTTVALTGGSVVAFGMPRRPTTQSNQNIIGNANPHSGSSAHATQNDNIPGAPAFGGGTVTPGASVAVTIGAGGSGIGTGSAGYAIISWEV